MKKIALMLIIPILCFSACKKQVCENPFFCKWDTPYGVPPFDKIKFEHFKPAFLKGMEEEDKAIDAIVNNSEAATFENTIKALQYTGDLLDNVQSAFGVLSSANTNDSIQALSKEMSPLFSKHRDNISLNEKLFERVKSVYDNRESLNLNPEEKKLLEDEYLGFVRSGIALNAEDKAKLRKINQELSLLSLNFAENVLAETNDFQLVLDNEKDLSGLPEGLKMQAAEAAKAKGMEGKWLFSLQAPSYFPFMTYADNRELRHKMFVGYMMRGNNGNKHDNNEIVAKIVKLRTEKANLLGYKSHAAYVLERNMSKNPETVISFLDEIWTAALPVAIAEAKAQQEMINK
ncbi:MAG TPA: M3 family metallopeptidase, partial [Bacteroidales bacterium]|nr:M3 family metallopeptidase [Bacteroidales bacterium]